LPPSALKIGFNYQTFNGTEEQNANSPADKTPNFSAQRCVENQHTFGQVEMLEI
jgi:hypothetical protein